MSPRRTVVRAGASFAVAAILVAGRGAVAQSPPTPASVLGFRPGDDIKAATYDESVACFRKLDEGSDQVRPIEVGRTSDGRPWYLALISSAANLRDLDAIATSGRPIRPGRPGPDVRQRGAAPRGPGQAAAGTGPPQREQNRADGSGHGPHRGQLGQGDGAGSGRGAVAMGGGGSVSSTDIAARESRSLRSR